MTKIKLPETPGLTDKYIVSDGASWWLTDICGERIRPLNSPESRMVAAAYSRRCEHHAEEVKRLEAMVADRDREYSKLLATVTLLYDRERTIRREAAKREHSQWRGAMLLGMLGGVLGTHLGLHLSSLF